MLGAAAVGVTTYVAAAALAVTLSVAGGTARVQFGPVVFLVVERDGGATATTFGVGLALVTLLGGCVNAVAAAVVERKRRNRPIA